MVVQILKQIILVSIQNPLKFYTCIIIFLVIDMFKLYNSKVTVSTHFIKTIQNKQIHVSEEVLNSIEARIHSNVPSLYPEEIDERK